jgi:hypothetical protein
MLKEKKEIKEIKIKLQQKKQVDGVSIYLLQLVEKLALEMVGVLQLKTFKRR